MRSDGLKTQAVILDLDGLVVDSEPIHRRAYNAYLQQHGVNHQFDEEEYGRVIAGIPARSIADYLITRFDLGLAAAELLAEREELYQALLDDSRNIAGMPGLAKMLQSLHAGNMALAIASGSPRRQVETILRGLGIGSYFPVVVTGSDVSATKPAPDVYLRAVHELGIPGSESIAVEDSLTGIVSAKAAGLRVIAVPNQYTRQQDLSLADARVENLEQVLGLLE
jgi:HAD superfamily hydrolase (TIGR01509 family)